ncbi:rhamnogalacturonan acetylesterase [Cerasicoccus maritimus]|uniref:rhamnogalacturonan acetylesterase n=1 Tax=Cerasicoccus maritimus TaxID=490089 RepID=UPI002852AE28|nr:rhamnogalacturonan acetylesterase [Cerasicoccus maritimus]
MQNTYGSLCIGLAADSTVADYEESEIARGWGQFLGESLPGVRIANLASCGRSTKTFREDGFWDALLEEKPDIVLIQFGHNDSHKKGLRESTDAATDYRENLARYVQECRDAGALPILVTPPHRRTFEADGKLTRELLPYVDSMRGVAQKMSVPLVDLYELIGARYEELGERESTYFTLNTAQNVDVPGANDRTHFTERGARELAEMVAKELTKLEPRLRGVG